MLGMTLLMGLVAYLMGSICSAILVCKTLRLPDPRSIGSGNPGATNVLRIGGKFPAALTLFFDVLKGVIPVWGSYFLGLPPLSLGVIALAACLGHMYPLFFHFKGGKAVATAIGALAPIGWDMTGLLLGTWLVVARLSGYSSLAAIVTVILAPLYTWWLKPLYTGPVMMLSLLMLWRHRSNIKRLLAGTESKLGVRHTDDS